MVVSKPFQCDVDHLFPSLLTEPYPVAAGVGQLGLAFSQRDTPTASGDGGKGV